MRSITMADAGNQIALNAGESFDVVLAGNPTTGYQWEVAEIDAATVKQTGQVKFEPSSMAAGAGGHFTFRFKAVGAGQTPVQLVYRRPFETNTPPIQTFEIRVVVK